MSGIVASNFNESSGVVAASAAGPTISASDPTTSTNAELGTQWANSTSGEFYILTDATADANIWTNVGAGTDDIKPIFYQGESFGYTCGSATHTIDRFSLTSQADATDVGDLVASRSASTPGKSTTHGFSMGGDQSGTENIAIDTYAFSSSANATDHGDLTAAGYGCGGASSTTHIYAAAGAQDGLAGRKNVIDKCATSSSSNSTDVGDLTNSIWYTGGCSSDTYGYVAGGYPTTNVIQKWAFARDGNATDVGHIRPSG